MYIFVYKGVVYYKNYYMTSAEHFPTQLTPMISAQDGLYIRFLSRF